MKNITDKKQQILASEIRRGDVIKFSTPVESGVYGIVHDVNDNDREDGKLSITINSELDFLEGYAYHFLPNKSLVRVGHIHPDVLS